MTTKERKIEKENTEPKTSLEIYKEKGKSIMEFLHAYENYQQGSHAIFIDSTNEKRAEHLESIKKLSEHIFFVGALPDEDRFNDIRKQIRKLNKTITNCEKKIDKLEDENIELKRIIYNDTSSFGSQKKIQYIPVDIYIDTNDPQTIFGIYESVLNFINAIGFEKAVDFKAEKGSWIKRIIAKSRMALTSDEVTDRLKEAEYGIEVNTILKPQSEIDKNQSEALLNILKSVENAPNAVIRIGALIVVKMTNATGEVSIQSRTLSIKELHLLNKKPELLQNPQQILFAFSNEIDDTDHLPEVSDN